MRLPVQSIVAGVLLLGLGGSAIAQNTAPAQPVLPETVDAFGIKFDEWVEKRHPASAILVVRRSGKTVFIKGYRVDPNRPSLTGSLSKAITGVCVATLIRDGRLAFTTPMREALPQFLKKYGPVADRRFEDVTVEQLLVHRSGLIGNPDGDPMHAMLRKRAEAGLGHIAAVQPLLAEHLKQHRMVRDPGGAFAYSNTGYKVLVAVIEERTGRTYEDYCRQAVFGKLGIAMPKLDPDWRMFSGAGGWLIPGADYLAMLDVFDPANPFLGDAVKSWIDQAQTKWSPDIRREWYSLGVYTRTDPGRWQVSHGGMLNSRGKDAHGRPIAAFVEANGSRMSNGTGIFFSYPWMQGAGEASRELIRDIGTALKSVRKWP